MFTACCSKRRQLLQMAQPFAKDIKPKPILTRIRTFCARIEAPEAAKAVKIDACFGPVIPSAAGDSVS